MGDSVDKSGPLSLSLTPAGLGALVLVIPGIMLGAVAAEPALLIIVLGAILLILVNIIWAWLILRKVQITAGCEGIATVGQRTNLNVKVDGPNGADIELRIHPESNRRWDAAVLPSMGTILMKPSKRGVFTSVDGGTRTSFPLGLVWIRRRCAITFSRPLYVAPAHVPTELSLAASGYDGFSGLAGEEFEGLRRYVAGDLQRDIHWPSVARTGLLMVRERPKRSECSQIHVVVDLGLSSSSDAEADQVLGECRTAIERFLNHVDAVRLTTSDLKPGQPGPVTSRSEMVSSHAELSARLASVDRSARPTYSRYPDDLVLFATTAGLSWESE